MIAEVRSENCSPGNGARRFAYESRQPARVRCGLVTGTRANTGAWAFYRDGVLVGRYDGQLPNRHYGQDELVMGAAARASAINRGQGVEIHFTPDGHDLHALWFSGPLGRPIAAIGNTEKGTVVMIGAFVSPRLGAVYFTPNETHHAVVDGANVYLNGNAILQPGARSVRFAFDSNNTFHLFLLSGNRLVRVDGSL